MEDELKLRVDEDGFVALVAPDTYRGFVDENWELGELVARFVEQMNCESLFIAYPGTDSANGHLSIATEPPKLRNRTAAGIVQVGEAGLWQTNYTQLTMAAQFTDEPPVTRYYSERLLVDPGRYLVTLHEDAANESALVLTMTLADPETKMTQTAVPWFE